ncbi:hypothetical protein [Aestuariibius sp. HNIBRBA575]|uniref:hypothetical protein n=1 Tax=Aestuariibius sp. HNIBRBA575 TaxID=3233343 RepID=UPI0034A34EB9
MQHTDYDVVDRFSGLSDMDLSLIFDFVGTFGADKDNEDGVSTGDRAIPRSTDSAGHE